MLVFVAVVAAIAYAAYRGGAAIDRRRRLRRVPRSRTGAGSAPPSRRPSREVASSEAPAASPPEPGTLEAVFARIDALLRGER